MDISVKAHLINEQVYDHVASLITEGEFAPGQRLDERRLAERMGVSRTPLREAIGRLVTEGIVQHRPHQGIFVATFTLKQINDIYVVRMELESLAIRLAATRLGPKEIAKLRRLVTQCHEELEAGQISAFETSDRRFHGLFAQLSDNQTLISCLQRLGVQIQVARHLANQRPGLPANTRRTREAVVSALEAGSVERAVQAMTKHIDDARIAALAQLQEGSPPK